MLFLYSRVNAFVKSNPSENRSRNPSKLGRMQPAVWERKMLRIVGEIWQCFEDDVLKFFGRSLFKYYFTFGKCKVSGSLPFLFLGLLFFNYYLSCRQPRDGNAEG